MRKFSRLGLSAVGMIVVAPLVMGAAIVTPVDKESVIVSDDTVEMIAMPEHGPSPKVIIEGGVNDDESMKVKVKAFSRDAGEVDWFEQSILLTDEDINNGVTVTSKVLEIETNSVDSKEDAVFKLSYSLPDVDAKFDLVRVANQWVLLEDVPGYDVNIVHDGVDFFVSFEKMMPVDGKESTNLLIVDVPLVDDVSDSGVDEEKQDVEAKENKNAEVVLPEDKNEEIEVSDVESEKKLEVKEADVVLEAEDLTEEEIVEELSVKSESSQYGDEIKGQVWYDSSANGVFDTGEKPAVGKKLVAVLEADPNKVLSETSVQEDGSYTFAGMGPTFYLVYLKDDAGIVKYSKVGDKIQSTTDGKAAAWVFTTDAVGVDLGLITESNTTTATSTPTATATKTVTTVTPTTTQPIVTSTATATPTPTVKKINSGSLDSSYNWNLVGAGFVTILASLVLGRRVFAK